MMSTFSIKLKWRWRLKVRRSAAVIFWSAVVVSLGSGYQNYLLIYLSSNKNAYIASRSTQLFTNVGPREGFLDAVLTSNYIDYALFDVQYGVSVYRATIYWKFTLRPYTFKTHCSTNVDPHNVTTHFYYTILYLFLASLGYSYGVWTCTTIHLCIYCKFSLGLTIMHISLPPCITSTCVSFKLLNNDKTALFFFCMILVTCIKFVSWEAKGYISALNMIVVRPFCLSTNAMFPGFNTLIPKINT